MQADLALATLTYQVVEYLRAGYSQVLLGGGMDNNSVSELNTIWDEAKGHIEQGNYEKAIEI